MIINYKDRAEARVKGSLARIKTLKHDLGKMISLMKVIVQLSEGQQQTYAKAENIFKECCEILENPYR